MSCEGCHQKLFEANEAKKKVVEEARRLAKQTGEWYGIYTDERGIDRCIPYSLRNQYPNIYRFITPHMPDA